ncbi:MAG: serine hydroxymethyltransferase [Myxococcales bacterium]|nr:serine hydroxymethyltransferase [Myxococcales bacterium]|tara:strand:+ start:5024 stop:6289 length:1266 start_codon:yes stop_codon:yes gene_type:complete
MSAQSLYPGIYETDPEIAELCALENERQATSIRLIPSENYVTSAVLEATGSVLTNKYSEGYADKRYYEGQAHIDAIEKLAVQRACALFGADHANVQPYSGSPANLAVYTALLEPGDLIMGLSLPHGGHLTHGWKVSATGKFWTSTAYEVDPETHRLDYDAIRKQALEERPRMIVAGATAYPRTIDFSAFRSIADEIGAYFLADIAHISGLVATGVHPSPVPHADVVSTTTHKTLRGPRGGMIMCREEFAKAVDRAVFPGLQGGPHNHTTAGLAVALKEASTDAFANYSRAIVDNAKLLAGALKDEGFDLVTGGTDNHLILIDVVKTTNDAVAGKPFAKALDRAGIVANYNTVPFDQRKPFNPSGLRLGTPAVTSRGMGDVAMVFIAKAMREVLDNLENETVLERIRNEVFDLCKVFPAPGL